MAIFPGHPYILSITILSDISIHFMCFQPFALITWGCVYLMSWVDMEPSKRWIQDHALHTAESAVYQDGFYDYGKN